MKKSLPCLSALIGARRLHCAATAQDGAAAAVSATASRCRAASWPQRRADRRCRPAIGCWCKRPTSWSGTPACPLACGTRSSIGGQQLYGVGSYWQQGSGEELQRPARAANRRPGCRSCCRSRNSRFLWIDRRLPTGRSVTRIDLRQLRADPALSAGEPRIDLEPGEASWSPIQPELTAHCGGLPSLLAALGDNFSFLPPQAMRLALAPPLPTQPTNVPVFAVVGHWKPEKLAALLTESQDDSAEVKSRSRQREPAARKSFPSDCRRRCCCWWGRPICFRTGSNIGGWRRRRRPASDGAADSLSAQRRSAGRAGAFGRDVRRADRRPANSITTRGTPTGSTKRPKLLERLRKQRQAEVAGARRGGAAR